jgi:hypothetical protein
MRIISVRPGPVALALSLVYTVFGLGVFLIFEFTQESYLSLPFGIVAPLIHFNINLNLPRTTSLGFNLLYGAAALLSYALTGALTGGVGTLCFNFVAGKMGGIPARFVGVEQDDPTP